VWAPGLGGFRVLSGGDRLNNVFAWCVISVNSGPLVDLEGIKELRV